MNTRRCRTLVSSIGTIALALVVAAPTPAAADAPSPAPGANAAPAPAPAPQGKPHDPSRMIERFDKNSNHALEASEVPAKMWAHLSVADANKDGSITLKELQDAHAAGKLPMHHRGGGPDAQGPAE